MLARVTEDGGMLFPPDRIVFLCIPLTKICTSGQAITVFRIGLLEIIFLAIAKPCDQI